MSNTAISAKVCASTDCPLVLQKRSSATSVITLLYLSYLLSFSDRIIFGMSLKPIKSLLDFSDSELGLLSGAAFALSYALFSPLGGIIVDRCRRKMVLTLAITFFSGMTLLTGFATSFYTMALARVGVGIGESFVSPLAVSLISDTVPRQGRARKFGLYLSAGALGSVFALLMGGLVVHNLTKTAGLALPLIGRLLPWQGLFAAAALPGFLLAIVVAAVLKEPVRTATVIPRDDIYDFDNIGRFVKHYWGLIVAMFLGLAAFQLPAYTFSTWSVVFFERVHGWSQTRSALTLGSTTAISTLVGCLACGPIIDALRRRGHFDAPLRVGMAAGLTFAIFGTAGMLAPSSLVAIPLLIVASFTSYMPAVTIHATMGDVIPSAARGRFAALHILAIGIVANAVGPFLVGYFNDKLFPEEAGIRYSLPTTFILAALIGSILVIPGLRLYRRRMAELDSI